VDSNPAAGELQNLAFLPPQLSAILDAVAVPQIVVLADDPDFTIAAVSDAYLETTHNHRQELVGHGFFASVLTAYDLDDLQHIRASFKRAIASGRPDRLLLPRHSLSVINTPVLVEDGVTYVIHSHDITSRRAAEQQLQQQWQTFDTVLSHIPDLCYIFDLDGRFTYANKALLSMWQKSGRNGLGKNMFEAGYPPELAERFQAQLHEVMETKQPLRDETPFTLPNGETGHFEYIYVPVLDAAGHVKAVAGSTRDITERTKSKLMLEQDRARWRKLLEQAPAGIAVIRAPTLTFEWANETYLRLIGRNAAAVVGKTVIEAIPEVKDQEYLALLDHVVETGEPITCKESLALIDRGDGLLQDCYVNFALLPIRNLSGEVEGVFVHAIDVTDMVLTRKRIELSESQFRTLAESIPHLAWMADENGSVFWFNQRYCEFTGKSFEELAGWGWQDVPDPKVLPDVLKCWNEAISSGQPVEITFPIRSASGEYRSFLTRVQPIKNDLGRVIRWFGTNTDITAQLETENELRRINRELEEFSYVAGHDLREPLRTTNLYGELLLKKLGSADTEVAEMANVICRSVRRLDTLLKDLLTFYQTVHSAETRQSSADLSASLSEALAALDDQIKETKAMIQADPLPVVKGDGVQMAHLFQNLLSNAMKYRNPAVPPKIYISAESYADGWLVSVRDNGMGFDAAYSQQIFGLFKRLHGPEFAGSGLGLSICQRIVERYGGRIWANSTKGEGSVFCFTVLRPN